METQSWIAAQHRHTFTTHQQRDSPVRSLETRSWFAAQQTIQSLRDNDARTTRKVQYAAWRPKAGSQPSIAIHSRRTSNAIVQYAAWRPEAGSQPSKPYSPYAITTREQREKSSTQHGDPKLDRSPASPYIHDAPATR